MQILVHLLCLYVLTSKSLTMCPVSHSTEWDCMHPSFSSLHGHPALCCWDIALGTDMIPLPYKHCLIFHCVNAPLRQPQANGATVGFPGACSWGFVCDGQQRHSQERDTNLNSLQRSGWIYPLIARFLILSPLLEDKIVGFHFKLYLQL